MIYFGIFVLVLAILLSLKSIKNTYQEQALTLESDYLSLAQKGLHKEFVFLDLNQLRKYTRYLACITLIVSIYFKTSIPFIIGITSFWWLPAFVLRYVKRQRQIKFEKQFANSLPQIASILRAGHTFERSLQSLSETEANPLKQELELVLKELRLGSSMEETLEGLLQRFPNRDLEILIRAISISRRVGSNLAEVFSTVSDMIQSRSKLKDKLSALTSQGKAQAWVAILMPVGILIVLNFLDPGYLSPLFFTTPGKAVLGICAVMLSLGGFWIYKICNMELVR